MTTTPDTVLPPNSTMGSDGRAHHEFGFSFMTVADKCAGARRSKVSSTNLKEAGERGIELHGVLENLVLQWAETVSIGKVTPLLDLYEANIAKGLYKGHPVADLTSLRRVATEISPFFSPEPGMLIGTEERIDLRNEEGEIISFGYYDLFLKLGKTVLVIDHKFVRKEVDAAEVNRQGHCLAVAVWQTYDDVEDVVVLFTMPECESSMHRFNRTEGEQRLTRELSNIVALTQQPFKTLQAGDHCVYCNFRTTCPAAIGTMKTMVTAISPLAVPAEFAPQLIKTAEDMALLRYWGDTLQPIIDAIKEESMKWAQNQQGIAVTVNGQHVEYAVQSRAMPRQLAEPVEIWKKVADWMPVEAMLSGCKCSITKLEEVVVALITDRLISEGKTPNSAKIAADFSAMLEKEGLLSREEGRTYFLKRVKASAKKKKLKNAEPDERTPIEPQDRQFGGPESHDAQ